MRVREKNETMATEVAPLLSSAAPVIDQSPPPTAVIPNAPPPAALADTTPVDDPSARKNAGDHRARLEVQGLVRSANQIAASLIGGLSRADEATPIFANALDRGANRIRACAPAVSETLRAMATAVRANDPAALHAIEKSQGDHPLDGNAAALRDLAKASARVISPPREDFSASIDAEKEVAAAIAGFVPVAAEIAALPDIVRAGGHVYHGRDSAIFELAFAGAALVPGLQFLKEGRSFAGPAALKAAAMFEDPAARQGMKILAETISSEAHTALKAELRILNVARTELVEQLERHLPSLPQNERKIAMKCQNSLRDHLHPSDVVGWLRDKMGKPVRKAEGEAFQHLKEVDDAMKSMKTLIGKFKALSLDELRTTESGLRETLARLKLIADKVME